MSRRRINRLSKRLPGIAFIAYGRGTYGVSLNGAEIARADVVDDGAGDYLTNIHVEKAHRRKGVAEALYGFIETDLGRALKPSPRYQSPEARQLWEKRRHRA